MSDVPDPFANREAELDHIEALEACERVYEVTQEEIRKYNEFFAKNFDLKEMLKEHFRRTAGLPPTGGPRLVLGDYLGSVDFKSPEMPEPIELHVWQNSETGQIFAIDNLELPTHINSVQDPYNPNMRVVFEDTFTGLPK